MAGAVSGLGFARLVALMGGTIGADSAHRPRILPTGHSEIDRTVGGAMPGRPGCSVELAADGAEAPAADCGPILTDVHMPTMDGLEATRRPGAASGDARSSLIAPTADAASASAPRRQEGTAMSSGPPTLTP
ncbi:MAG: hypothetical protein ACK4WC_17310 [Rubrimonas sp.]